MNTKRDNTPKGVSPEISTVYVNGEIEDISPLQERIIEICQDHNRLVRSVQMLQEELDGAQHRIDSLMLSKQRW